MSFAYYAEPGVVVGDESSESRQLYTGLGSDDGDDETATIGIFDECEHASIRLTRDELTAVVVDLVQTLALMVGSNPRFVTPPGRLIDKGVVMDPDRLGRAVE